MLTEPAGLPLRGYRLGERLGTGRDGTVFAARLPGVERDFAIRVVREEIADRPEFVRSFEADAHRVASLRHPAIVPIHDYWREPGAAYLVMRRMHGGTLADRLERGPLTGAAVAALVTRIGGALVAAADGGIVHGRVSRRQRALRRRRRCLPLRLRARRRRTRPGPAATTCTTSPRWSGSAWPSDRGAVAEVLARGLSTAGRPPMAEFVPMLVAALTGGRARRREIAVPNPYKGLRAFDEADAADFFGRADLVDEIARPARQRRPARTARPRRRRVRHRQVQRRAGRAVAAGASRRRPRVAAVVRDDDAARVLAVQGAGRGPASRRGRRPGRRRPSELADDAAGSTGCCGASCPATASCCWSSTSSRSCSPWRASRTSAPSSTA